MAHYLKRMILQAYFLARAPFLFLIRACVRPAPAKNGAVSRILVIRLDRLGDFILSLPLIDSLRAAYPSAKIDVMVKPYLADLAGMAAGVDNVIVYRGLSGAMRMLPGLDYDIAIDMLRDYRIGPALVALFSKAPVRIGFKGGYREILLSHPVGDSERADRGMVEYNLELLKPLHILPAVKIPRLTISKKTTPQRLMIAIHPGGYYGSQKWGAERFGSLTKMIAETYDARIIVIGGPGDKIDVRIVVAGAKGKDTVEEAYPSMKGLAGILSDCSLLVCNNSGPLHLAAALGVPTVSVMGPTEPVLWWPKGDNQVVIRKGVKCSPCSLGVCRNHACMDLITVDEVFGEVRKLLEKVYGHKK